MRTRVGDLSPRAMAFLAAAAVLLYALSVWFMYVSPKRSEAALAAEQLAAAELRLVEAQAAANSPSSSGVPVSEILRLAKAMPSGNDQAGLVLELTRLAEASGVALRTIIPQPAVAVAGEPTMISVEVTVSGGYHKISGFLRRIRTLVTIRRGKLRATGRLLNVQNVELVESLADGFPTLDGTITLYAYVYDGPIAPEETPRSETDELEPSSTASATGSTD